MPDSFSEILSPQDGYAAWAALYDDDGNPLTAIEGPVMRGWFGDLRGRRALDLGCGTGRHTAGLLDAGAACVVALDASPEMMSRARAKLAERPVVWARHVMPGRLPVADESFALVVLGLVAEHLVDLHGALAEAARALEPGGACVLSALHPDRTAEGQRARFIDPISHRRWEIETIHRSAADYFAAGAAAGLAVVEERTLRVPATLVETHPRAGRYVGVELGWAVRWVKPG
jgi:malonyl-CoA O-methyltransferase